MFNITLTERLNSKKHKYLKTGL